MTILDNVLTVGDSAEVKRELVGPPSPRRVSRRSRRGVVRNLATADFAKGFRQW